MNQNNQDHFQLSAQEARNSKAMIARVLGWIALFALVISTGVHAVSLVISQIGVSSGVMSIIRVVSPVLVEIIAAIVAIGFASHAWRGPQKLVGISVEILWVAFAALNLLTSFAIETNHANPIVTIEQSIDENGEAQTVEVVTTPQLPAVLFNWLHYGLPLSALVAGALFYIQLRVDPEHKRQAEIAATIEMHKMADFSSEQAVLLSPQMASVRKQQGWLRVIAQLESQGYTAPQIDFLLSGVPGLKAVAAQVLTHGENQNDGKKTITQEAQPQSTQTTNHEPKTEHEPVIIPMAEALNENGNGVTNNRPIQQGQ